MRRFNKIFHERRLLSPVVTGRASLGSLLVSREHSLRNILLTLGAWFQKLLFACCFEHSLRNILLSPGICFSNYYFCFLSSVRMSFRRAVFSSEVLSVVSSAFLWNLLINLIIRKTTKAIIRKLTVFWIKLP